MEKWFTNRGQVVQVTAAVISLLIVLSNQPWANQSWARGKRDLILFILAAGWLLFSVAMFIINRRTKRTKFDPGPDISASVETDAIGLTVDSAEQEIAPDNSPWFFKYKLRVYWTNDGDTTIHLGKPIWKASEAGIKGNELMWRYQARQPKNPEKPWGDECEEIDVASGQRCRVWLGLNPPSFERAKELLDQGALGLLIVPVTTPVGLVDVYVRPRDRALKQWNAHAYDEQRKVLTERFMGMDHGAKEAIRILSFSRVMSAQRITDHLRQANFPNADKIFDGLRDDIVPLVARFGNASEFRINPALEKIVKEVVATDKKEFVEAASRLPIDQFAYRVKNEPGFEARYKVLAPKD
jgi:hypothetical protein